MKLKKFPNEIQGFLDLPSLLLLEENIHLLIETELYIHFETHDHCLY